MSKSEPNPKGRIDITDSPDMIRDKIKKAMTDCSPEVTFDPEKRPGISNLILLQSLFTDTPPEEICEALLGSDTVALKASVTEAVVEGLRPMRERVEQLLADEQYLDRVLKEGAEKASDLAQITLSQVKKAMGLT
jgi:tryptophanyl-tRNA synthetase